MKIVKDILPKELFDACVENFRSKLDTDCWSSSNFAWKPFLRQGIHGSTVSTDVPKTFADEIEKHIKPHAPEFSKLTCRYNVWQPGSGIGIHSDEHHLFGATIYLNEYWHPNAGGWFIWMDGDEFKAVLPDPNLLVLNDCNENHLVTTVAHDVPEYRYTIQIWGDL